MADLKISQLPLFPATGDTTGFYVVANNSGETITYKMTKETLIGQSGSSGTSGSSGSSGTSGSAGSSGTSGSSGSSGTSGSSGSSGTGGSSGSSGTSGSSGSSGTSGDSMFQDGTGLNSVINIYQSSGDTTQAYSVVMGGYDNSISGSASGSTIVGGYNNDITNGGNYNGIFAGHEHEIGSGGGHHGIFAGQNNFIQGEYNNAVIGGINNSINWGESQFISGSNNSTLGGGANTFIIGAAASSMVSTFKSGIIGGESNQINGDSRFSLILNGYANTLSANAEEAFIVGSRYATIQGSYPNQSGIYSSNDCSISGDNASNRMVFVGSYDSDMGGLERAVGIGLSGRTPQYSATTYVENSHTYLTESFGVVNVGSVSGTISVDLSLGTLYTFTLTGSSSVDFINWKEGQRVQFFVYSNGSHNITAMTISGGGDVYADGGTLPAPTNNGYTLYTGVILNGDMILLEDKSLAAI
jgi:hypothetical protein